MDPIDIFPEADKMPLFWANLTAKEKIIINQGGTYSGKSQSIVRIVFLYAIMYDNLKCEIASTTIPKLTSDTLEIALHLARTNPVIKSCIRSYHMTRRIFTLKNGSKIIFNSYEKAISADGPKRDILYLSEARNFQWPTAYQLIKRTNKKIFIDYNPVAQFWAHDKIINSKTNRNGTKEFPSVKVIRSWHIHNNFISQEKHDEIENINDKQLWKAYARGLTAKVSGLCYPDWVEVSTFPETDDCIWGIDFGYTNDPTAIVKCAINQTVNGIKYDYVFKELSYTTGIPPGMISQILNENGYKFGQPVYIDHDQAMQRELRQLRIVAVKAQKGKGSVSARVLHLRTKKIGYIGENIQLEHRRYSFLQKEDGSISNEPEDRFNHCMDSCGYAAFTHAVRHGFVKGYDNESDDDNE
jgi:phage terminase large subunit